MLCAGSGGMPNAPDERRRLGLTPKLKPLKVFSALLERMKLASTPTIGLEHPKQYRFSRKECPTERFTVAGIQLLTGEAPPHCAPNCPRQDGGKTKVHPDNRSRARPHYFSDHAVIAVNDPPGCGCCHIRQTSKFGLGLWHPSRPPMERIKFDVRGAQYGGQLPGKRGFAAATGSDNDNAGQMLDRCVIAHF